MLSPARGQITHVLLTRAPLYRGRSPFSCDLHVLGAPLTFVLSQDQTLQLRLSSSRAASVGDRSPRALAFGNWKVASGACTEVRTPPRAFRGTHSSKSHDRPYGTAGAQTRAYDSVFKERGGPAKGLRSRAEHRSSDARFVKRS